MTGGVFDLLPLEGIAEAEEVVRRVVVANLPDLVQQIEAGEPLTNQDREALLYTARKVIEARSWGGGNANP